MEFKDRLVQIIELLGVEKTALAAQCGVGRGTIFNYLKGKSFPDVNFFNLLKEHYPQVDIEWLITGVKNPSGELMLIDDRLNIPEKSKENNGISGIMVNQTSEKDTRNPMTDDDKRFYQERIRWLESKVDRLERKLDRFEEREDPMEDHDDVLVKG